MLRISSYTGSRNIKNQVQEWCQKQFGNRLPDYKTTEYVDGGFHCQLRLPGVEKVFSGEYRCYRKIDAEMAAAEVAWNAIKNGTVLETNTSVDESVTRNSTVGFTSTAPVTIPLSTRSHDKDPDTVDQNQHQRRLSSLAEDDELDWPDDVTWAEDYDDTASDAFNDDGTDECPQFVPLEKQPTPELSNGPLNVATLKPVYAPGGELGTLASGSGSSFQYTPVMESELRVLSPEFEILQRMCRENGGSASVGILQHGGRRWGACTVQFTFVTPRGTVLESQDKTLAQFAVQNGISELRLLGAALAASQ